MFVLGNQDFKQNSAPQQLGCDAEKLKSPINLQPPITYEDFKISYNVLALDNVRITKGSSGLYEILSDFGILKLNLQYFSLYKITFVSPSETSLNGQNFPLEMQIQGSDKHNKKLVVSILFEQDKVANSYLLKMGIGQGIIKNLSDGTKQDGRASTDYFHFNLNNFLENSEYFMKYDGKNFFNNF